MDVLTIGERIMIYRKRAHLSKTDLAKICNVSVATVTRYENDNVEPSLEILADIATALDITMNKLITGFDDPKRSVPPKPLV